MERKKKKREVQERRDTSSKKSKRAGTKREEGDALVINSVILYSEVFTAIRSDAKLVNLGIDGRTQYQTYSFK